MDKWLNKSYKSWKKRNNSKSKVILYQTILSQKWYGFKGFLGYSYCIFFKKVINISGLFVWLKIYNFLIIMETVNCTNVLVIASKQVYTPLLSEARVRKNEQNSCKHFEDIAATPFISRAILCVGASFLMLFYKLIYLCNCIFSYPI